MAKVNLTGQKLEFRELSLVYVFLIFADKGSMSSSIERRTGCNCSKRATDLGKEPGISD